MTFERLLHSDWSKDKRGRVTAVAHRTAGGWRVDLPAPTGDLPPFVDRLCEPVPTLAGFDFPIGLPRAFGQATGLASFPDALNHFGQGDWSDFYRVAETPEDISSKRPFYPNSPGGRLHRQLLEGLQVAAISELLRACERAHPGRTAASPLFWTMGAKQVGKAAITGWRDVLRPARAGGCRLWPFDGDLAHSGTTIVETYPGEAYAHLGIKPRTLSKEDPSSRASTAPLLLDCASRRRVELSADLTAAVTAGFAHLRNGSDHFDALVGLLDMIQVLDIPRAAAPPNVDRVWEGWILGQAAQHA